MDSANETPENDVVMSGSANAEPEPEMADTDDQPSPANAGPAAEPEPESAPVPSEPSSAPPAAREAPLTMADLLDEEQGYMAGPLERGGMVDGVVIRKDAHQLVLDIGAKQEGIVPAADLARLPREVLDAISVGDRVTVVVMRSDGREGETLVSLYQAQSAGDWDRAKDAMESAETLSLSVVGTNKGGVLVQYGQLQGFVPLSHMMPGPGRTGSPEALLALVGQDMSVKVIEVNRKRRRLIMSERQAMRERRAERKQTLIEELQVGDVRSGIVTSVADFGVFVDLGGADGLVHVSELTHERGRMPADVVRVGQEVEVVVLSVDRERRRIGLSMKRLAKDPWLVVEESHYLGELVEGTVANLAKFGAFVRLDDGLEGLVHISELADLRIEDPAEAVRPGQRVAAEIIAIDAERRRLGLSIRRVPEHLRLHDAGPAPAAAGAMAPTDTEPASTEPADMEAAGTVAAATEVAEVAVPATAQIERDHAMDDAAPSAESATTASEAAPPEPDDATMEPPPERAVPESDESTAKGNAADEVAPEPNSDLGSDLPPDDDEPPPG